MPAISIKPEVIFHIYDFPVTNSLILAWIVIISFFFIAKKYYNDSQSVKKSGFFYFFNFMVKGIYSLFESILGEKTKYFFPLLLSYFLYIILQNWFGLLPGVGSLTALIYEHGEYIHAPIFRGANADLNTTFVLATLSVFMVQVYGIQFVGFKNYMKKYVNLTNPINFFLGILEIFSELSKILSFSFRLFGNIFAGEVLLTIVAFLVPVLASFPFILLEIFVGFIQALVFSMLTAVLISGAISSHH
jgi:F-type H+-transporting ATPase subunit a